MAGQSCGVGAGIDQPDLGHGGLGVGVQLWSTVVELGGDTHLHHQLHRADWDRPVWVAGKGAVDDVGIGIHDRGQADLDAADDSDYVMGEGVGSPSHPHGRTAPVNKAEIA